MCTAATYQSAGFYFGRTLDYEVSYGNQIVIPPRNYALRFRHTEDQPHHYAIIGMGLVAEDYPLYYDAMNEKGLCMAGLNFVGNAAYSAPGHDKENYPLATGSMCQFGRGQRKTAKPAAHRYAL